VSLGQTISALFHVSYINEPGFSVYKWRQNEQKHTRSYIDEPGFSVYKWRQNEQKHTRD